VRRIGRATGLAATAVLVCSAVLSAPPAEAAPVQDESKPIKAAILANTGRYPWASATCQTTPLTYNGVQYCRNDDWLYKGGLYDTWGYSYRNCTSWVAWRLSINNKYTMPHAIGDASAWGNYFAGHGHTPNHKPALGAIAWKSGGDHVAYVEGVSADKSHVTISEYNEAYYPNQPTTGDGLYDTRTVPTGNFEYIHVKDLIKPTFTANSPPGGKQGVAYSYTFAASGYPAPTFSRASGTLPPGLSLSGAGKLSGTPSKGGAYSFAVKASNSAGSVVSPTRTVTITAKPVFTADAPPDGAQGQTYSYTFAASGYPAPTFSLASGTLPDGLTLSSGGILSGTPTQAATYSFAVNAANSAGTATGATLSISIAVPPTAPVFTADTPPDGTEGQPYSYAFAASGHPAPTFSLASGALPPGVDLASDGTLSGTPTQAGSYTFAVSATNSSDTATTPDLTITIAAAAAAPVVTVTSPGAGATVTAPFSVSGSATDGTGVSQVTVELFDLDTASYLQPDGSLGAEYDFPASLGTPSGTSTTWTVAVTSAPSGNYRVDVYAADTLGNAALYTNTVQFKAITVPGAPGIPSATSGQNGQSQVSWAAPTNNGGDPITQYLVQRVDTGTQRSAGSSPFTWTGLTNGTGYRFRVSACNSAGCGAWSAQSNLATPYTTPSQVGKPAVTSLNNAVTVSWSAPASGGSAITKYNIQGGASGSTTGNSITFSFGQDGSTKTFQVRACNAAGCGSWSASSNSVRAKTIKLAKGAAAPHGYWYDTQVTGAPGASMTLTCDDGTSTNWYSQNITLDSTGYYHDSTLCYSGDANPHWVTAGSLTSNKVNF